VAAVARQQVIIIQEFKILDLEQTVEAMGQLAANQQYSGQCPEHTHLLCHAM
jgi:hypothetical protein